MTINTRTMPRIVATRNPLRRQWEIALAHSGLKPKDVARVWGVGKNAINGVIAGTITSARIHQKIEAFIRKHAPAREAA